MAEEKSLEVIIRGKNVSQWETDAAGVAAMDGLMRAGFANTRMRGYVGSKFASDDAPPKLSSEDDSPSDVPTLLEIMQRARPELFETPVVVSFPPATQSIAAEQQQREILLGRHYITNEIVDANNVGMRWDESLGKFVVVEMTEAAELSVYDGGLDRHYEVKQDEFGMYYDKKE